MAVIVLLEVTQVQKPDLQQICQRFDEAIAYEWAGDFGQAALCYERIIHDFDGNDFDSIRARQAARWHLKWCIPLEAVTQRLQEHRQPVSLAELLGIARQLGEEELGDLPQELEKRLADHPQCLRLGRRLWIWTAHLEPCVQLARRTLAESQEPVSLKEVLRTAFADWAQTHPAFPDSTALDVLAGKLGDIAESVGREYAIPRHVISLKIEQLQEIIAERLAPVNLSSQMENLFPTVDFSPRLRSDFVAFVRSRLDHRFIQVSDQLWYLKSLLDFYSDSFHALFESQPLPQTTETFIQSKLFPSSEPPPRLHSAFCEFVQIQLRKNPCLIEIKDRWLSHDTLNALCQRAIHALSESGQVLSTREIVYAALAITPRPPDSALTELAELVQKALQKHPEVVQIARGQWWHGAAMGATLDRAWELLQQQGGPKPAHWLLEQCLGVVAGRGANIQALTERFDEALHADTRFLLAPSANGWLAVPPGPTHNNVAYHVLWESQQPLSLKDIVDAIRNRFQLMSFRLDLDHDNRFHQLCDGRWALRQWIWINDWAFEYLRKVGIPLQAKTIIDKVCQEQGLDHRLAIFTPEDDPRFVPTLHNRWVCRRLLTDAEVEQMLAFLVGVGEQGLALESLVQQVIGENANATDAAERLASDERFLSLDNCWFAREMASYSLSNEDVDRLYERLALEKPEQLPMLLADLVRQVLGRDCRLTDAEARLQADERFQETHPGFWAPQGFKPPPIERGRVISPAVRHKEEASEEVGLTIAEPETLTRRPSRQPWREAVVQSPQQVTVTLGHLDIRHGNLRVNPQLQVLLPEGVATVQFTDEENRAFIGYLDETGSLLDLRGWLAERQLTYGDKLLIQASPEPGVLCIRPTGERDNRVYQEAMQRQDVERLIQAARQTNKSYHDLMIEVMEFVGAPLHREHIYQLVDYNRTASRAHIFALLSLPDCPYEELRYFVSHGGGEWSFDRQRKEAFDMKMRELEAEAKDLRVENARLQERLRRQREHLETVEHEQKATTADVGRLSNQMEALQKVIAGLHERHSQLEEVNRQLQDTLHKQNQRIEVLERQNEALRIELAEAHRETDVQCDKATTLQAEREVRQAQIAALNRQNEQLLSTTQEQGETVQALASENEALRAKLSQAQEQAKQAQTQLEQRVAALRMESETLRAEMEPLREQVGRTQTLEEAVTNAQTEIKTLQAQLHRLQEDATAALGEGALHQEQVDALRQANADLAEEIAYLKACLERVQRALHSPVGKVFMLLVRLWNREDLSNL